MLVLGRDLVIGAANRREWVHRWSSMMWKYPAQHPDESSVRISKSFWLSVVGADPRKRTVKSGISGVSCDSPSSEMVMLCLSFGSEYVRHAPSSMQTSILRGYAASAASSKVSVAEIGQARGVVGTISTTADQQYDRHDQQHGHQRCPVRVHCPPSRCI